MTPEQIDTLNKMIGYSNQNAALSMSARDDHARLGNPRAAATWDRKLSEYQNEAAALRAALALAEQARVMGVIDHVQSQQEPNSEYGEGWKDACDEIRMNIESKAGEA
jgi:hypothetical protein